MKDQEIRAQALAAAIALGQSKNVRTVVQIADRLAAWIRTGELPALPPGVIE